MTIATLIENNFEILKVEDSARLGIQVVWARKNKGKKVWGGNIINNQVVNFSATTMGWGNNQPI